MWSNSQAERKTYHIVLETWVKHHWPWVTWCFRLLRDVFLMFVWLIWRVSLPWQRPRLRCRLSQRHCTHGAYNTDYGQQCPLDWEMSGQFYGEVQKQTNLTKLSFHVCSLKICPFAFSEFPRPSRRPDPTIHCESFFYWRSDGIMRRSCELYANHTRSTGPEIRPYMLHVECIGSNERAL